jgi:tetratricopeptide (TPR) repeat protein
MRFAHRPLSLILSLALLAAAGAGCRKEQPKAAAPSTAEADALLAAGKPVEALIAYQKLPASDGTARGTGVALSLLRRWDEADKALAPYAKKHPEDFGARSAWITSLVGRGEVAAARTEVAALAVAAPTQMPIQLYAAALAIDEGERRAALERLATFKPDPANPLSQPYELLVIRASLLRSVGQKDAAEAAMSESSEAPLRSASDAVSLAETYQRTGQLEMADLLLQKVTADAAALPAALRAAAEVALDLNKPERVAGFLARVPAAQAIPPVDGMLAARAKIGLGEHDAAIEQLSALVTALEKEKHRVLVARARLWLARALTGKGERDRAREVLLGIDDPGLAAERSVALAEVELGAGNAQAAIAALAPVIEKSGQAVGPRLLLASVHMKAGQPEEAKKVLVALAEAHPSDPRIPYTMATLLESAGDKAGAEREHRRALEVAPGSAAPLRKLMAMLDDSNRASEAEQLLRDQIQRAPRLAVLRQMLGQRLEKAGGDQTTAEAAFKAAIEVDGGSDGSWIALSDHYARTARPARALEVLDHVLRRAPDAVDALARAGAAYVKLGQAPAAIQSYERALALRPRDIGIQNNLALLLVEQPAARDRALALAEASHKAVPSSPLVLDTLGYVHLRRGEIETALPLLKKSAAALPDLPEAQHHLGLGLLLKGDQAAGRKLIEAARKLDPSLPTADQALETAKR